ncbi:MAG: hypothetical protein Tsb005_18040 [Gammaproteobacteria bacterium]
MALEKSSPDVTSTSSPITKNLNDFSLKTKESINKAIERYLKQNDPQDINGAFQTVIVQVSYVYHDTLKKMEQDKDFDEDYKWQFKHLGDEGLFAQLLVDSNVTLEVLEVLHVLTEKTRKSIEDEFYSSLQNSAAAERYEDRQKKELLSLASVHDKLIEIYAAQKTLTDTELVEEHVQLVNTQRAENKQLTSTDITVAKLISHNSAITDDYLQLYITRPSKKLNFFTEKSLDNSHNISAVIGESRLLEKHKDEHEKLCKHLEEYYQKTITAPALTEPTATEPSMLQKMMTALANWFARLMEQLSNIATKILPKKPEENEFVIVPPGFNFN